MRNYSVEFVAARIERDARDELYASLLGKSQTFHGRQRIGDIMARATNDVHMLNLMFSPGLMLILDSAMAIVVPLLLIARMDTRLLLVPVRLPGRPAPITLATTTAGSSPVSLRDARAVRRHERRPGRGDRRASRSSRPTCRSATSGRSSPATPGWSAT